MLNETKSRLITPEKKICALENISNEIIRLEEIRGK